jgi:hypothetical protein
VGCGHVLSLEEEHYVLDFFLFGPAAFDVFHTLASDVGDRNQLIRVGFNDLKGVFAKGRNN